MGWRGDAVLATLRPVRRACIAAVAALLLTTTAGQTAAATGDPDPSITPAADTDTDFGGDGAGGAPAPQYVDHLINGGKLAPLKNDDGSGGGVTSGLPRYLRLEAVGDRTDGGSLYHQEEGVGVQARLETENFGALSLDGVVRGGPIGGSLSLQQRKMPFDGGWLVNNGVGTVYTPAPSAMRNQYRFYLPNVPVAGLSTEWLHDGDLQLTAGVGAPGVFDGVLLSGFHPLGGVLATAGAQTAIGPHWQAALQVIGERGVGQSALGGDVFNTGPAFGQVNDVSLFGSLAWRGTYGKAQLNGLHSANNQGPAATGLWFDGAWNHGRINQNWGAFWLQRNLSWGYVPVSSDSEGLYYRASYQSQRWVLDGGFDAARSISGAGLSGALVTANVRYRLDLDTAVGAYGTYRLTSPGALDASLFVERQNRFGSGRLQLDASNQNGDTLGRVNLDETWGLQVGMRLMTSVSAVFEDNAGVRTTGFAGALSGGGEITHSLSWDGSAGYQSTRGAWAASGFTADIGLTQRLGHGLTLSATWFDNRSKTSTPSPITPLIPIPAPPSVSHSSAVFVTLRYEFSAGPAHHQRRSGQSAASLDRRQRRPAHRHRVHAPNGHH